MQLSIVIVCWNSLDVIGDCLESIYAGTRLSDLDVVVSDNGSVDGSMEFIRHKFPQVRILENGANLSFGRANNAGIRLSKGQLILVLNPDTIVHEGALDSWVAVAERHPEAGAFGCRVLNTDGSNQGCARPFPTLWRDLLAALYLRPLGYLSDVFVADKYMRWKGQTERLIDWQSGCALLVRADLLKRLNGFDEQLHFYYEDVDLCRRIWEAGYPIIYTPEATITHVGGQSTKSVRVSAELDRYRNRYRYFYKYYGPTGARRARITSIVWLELRRIGYELVYLVRPSKALARELELYRFVRDWNKRVDPVQLVEVNSEPHIDGSVPLATRQ